MESSDEEISEAANAAVGSLIPQKSQDRYNKEYEQLQTWCKEKKSIRI